MVHLSPVERVRLLPRTSIAISILQFRTFICIMSCLRTLKASDLAQVILGWGLWVGAILVVASSIPITIPGAIVIVRATSSMGMLKMSSWSRGKAWLLLSS